MELAYWRRVARRVMTMLVRALFARVVERYAPLYMKDDDMKEQTGTVWISGIVSGIGGMPAQVNSNATSCIPISTGEVSKTIMLSGGPLTPVPYDDLMNRYERLHQEHEHLQQAIDAMSDHLNAVYTERNTCVALLLGMALALGLTAGIGIDEQAEEGWQDVVFLDLPTGQVSWHIPRKELDVLFPNAVTGYSTPWDGHDTFTKYARVCDYAQQLVKDHV